MDFAREYIGFLGRVSPLATSIATFVVAKFAFLICIYSRYYIYGRWEKDISRRKSRIHKNCPSNKQSPAVTRSSSSVMISDMMGSGQRKSFSRVRRKQRQRRKSSIARERSRAVPFLGAMEGDEKAERLNMDHIFILFLDFLWGYIFIGPMAAFMGVKGTCIMQIRIFLIRRGWLTMKQNTDIEGLVATFCLEQTQVINYSAMSKKENNNTTIASFLFADFPYVDNNLQFQVADLFIVDIDLENKKFVQAQLDDLDLTASDALILLAFNTVAAQHVKIHALANWGTNDHPSLQKTNPFLRQNSIVTAMYNYFGYTGFHGWLRIWEKQGILSKGWSESDALIKCFDHGIRNGIGHHGNIFDLVPHSRFVNFVVKVRSIFMHQFGKNKHLFPGVDGEALFVGTILHSLDHTLLEWNLPEALWLDVDNPRFGKMAEITRIVRVGFTEDLSGLYFRKRFKGSGHPFYEAVYKKAAKIDKKLADNMDTCIIK